mmetsp:Transcript_5251/g.6860  ORF Transcript_5251/g.6860 Transcript_5251/m.6860 type:complete len:276 (+) Transcript_5251:138-965(+)|eukprot:CAMPEP_0204865232 /NCGR_PEP_ID=MMETSP1348-20121228/6269_1 /ASSEMBLY_ACC=CAM_ASM_000700 /TAXON_ID=215587 /ORGANISM="Aplanochytrium stocchinoi, Strain GSBS06" /LENGTH=275 /DNA_ID=CAMNT_0052016259 /DNA_START=53 /DNA_END=880 /DNA_ORIENTATION=+
MAQLYSSALKHRTEGVLEEDTRTWREKFTGACGMTVDEQATLFLNRFALQFQKQGVEAKEVCKFVGAVAEMFNEKAKAGNSKDGKSLKYSGVEFGDVYAEFVGESLTFKERKERFGPFDLDNNGNIDLIEFLLYFYKKEILKGYQHRNGVDSDIPEETQTEALMKEVSGPAVLIDKQLDQNILDLKRLEEGYNKTVAALKSEAVDGGSNLKKIQLAANLKKAEDNYKNDQKRFWSNEQIQGKLEKMMKKQEDLVSSVRAEIAAEDEAARGPTKKK